MQINSISKQSFGANPDYNTKIILFQMEENGIDTKPITDVMNRIYVGNTLTTKIAPSGEITMDIYDKGDQVKSLIKRGDGISVNQGNFKLKNREYASIKLLAALQKASAERNSNSKIWDKINFNLNDRETPFK